MMNTVCCRSCRDSAAAADLRRATNWSDWQAIGMLNSAASIELSVYTNAHSLTHTQCIGGSRIQLRRRGCYIQDQLNRYQHRRQIVGWAVILGLNFDSLECVACAILMASAISRQQARQRRQSASRTSLPGTGKTNLRHLLRLSK